MLKAEQGSLQIILDNLFENAVKYSPAHTAIVILMDKQRLSFKNELSAQNSLQREKMFDRGYRGGITCKEMVLDWQL